MIPTMSLSRARAALSRAMDCAFVEIGGGFVGGCLIGACLLILSVAVARVG